MNKIETPVNIKELKSLLTETNYDKQKTNFLIDGFTNGFSIGYEGPREVQMEADNLKLNNIGDSVILWNKVMKEVKLQRYAGPFEKIPYENYIQSPIGLVPKDNGKSVRLIFHLSHPRNCGTSVNSNTPKERCLVQYPDFSKPIELCILAGKSCYISKSDFSSAFRHFGIRRKDWKFLIMKAQSPFDGKFYYFVDKCLPFGASISCSHFQAFSDCVAHIMRVKARRDNVNYLDDFLFVALLKALCNSQIELFLAICKRINFPVLMEKTLRAGTQMTFLGFLIDTVRQLILIPEEKITKARTLIEKVLGKRDKKMTVKELQQICGLLNFLGCAIVPGRAFTRCLYAFTRSKNNLKKHYHIRLNSEMRSDFQMWLKFFNHPAIYSRGFLDVRAIVGAEEISMFSDASGVIGLG